MKKKLSALVAVVAMAVTASASMGCLLWILEEPKALSNMD